MKQGGDLRMLKVAIYGKGGIGKSTVTSNLAAAFASMGKKVIQIGCDPKADSTINLLGGEPLRPVMNYMREEDEEPEKLEDISKEGFGGVLCIETGGPTPGLGCAGRGIIATFQLLEDLRLFETYQPDVVLYDVLGDVVCGGFAAPIREGYAEKVLDRNLWREDGTVCSKQHFQCCTELRRQKLCESFWHCPESSKR